MLTGINHINQYLHIHQAIRITTVDKLNNLQRKLKNYNYKQANDLTSVPAASSNCKMSSLFNCVLSPQRTESLINGYCFSSATKHIVIDIRKIIISYFNHIVYTPNVISSEQSIDYMVKETLHFNIRMSAFDSHRIYIDIKFKKAPDIASLIQSCIYRFRMYFISTQTNDTQISKEYLFETAIWHCNQMQMSIPAMMNVNNYDLVGIEIEVLHLQWNTNRAWSKWPYPWNDNRQDLQLLMDDCDWFWNDFNNYCFGVNGKYCVHLSSEHALDYFKCKSLSKGQDILIMNNRYPFNDPCFIPLMSFISRVQKQINDIFLELQEMTITEDMLERTLYYEIKALCEQYRGIGRSLSVITINQQKVKINKICTKKNHGYAKSAKLYRNNKKKYKYNRW